MKFWKKRHMLNYAKQEIINMLLVDELLELWDACDVKYHYIESSYTADWVDLYNNKISYLYSKKFSKDATIEEIKEEDEVQRKIIYFTRSKCLSQIDLLPHKSGCPVWKPNQWYGYKSMRKRIKYLIRVTKKIYEDKDFVKKT